MVIKTNNLIYIYVFNDPVGNDVLDVKQLEYKRQRISTIVRKFATTVHPAVCVNNVFIESEQWKKYRLRSSDRIDIYPSVGFFIEIFSISIPMWIVETAASWLLCLLLLMSGANY